MNHLPTEPTNPTLLSGFDTASEDSWPTPVLRDLQFEKLCKLAKNAYLLDIQIRPEGAREWEFATAVLEFNHHPMAWLLGWAGIRIGKHRARWDRFLLVLTGAVAVILSLVVVLPLSFFIYGQNGMWKWILWLATASVSAALLTLLYFGVRRLEARQREQTLERYRCELSVRGSEHATR